MSDHGLRGKLPESVLRHYEVHEWKHAAAILREDFPEQLDDLLDTLAVFRVKHEHIIAGGGGKSKVASSLDELLYARGWKKKRWDTKILLDGQATHSPTHEVDCVKGRVAVEIEWSNKDPFYDRDLNNFRLLFDLRAISVGIIVTKSDELAGLFDDLGIWRKYGTSTTWMSKLLPRIEGGGGGGCPILVFGIRRHLYQGPGHA
ncbi:MAG: restriction endonuclease [Phycisphaerae bacterium]